jgi:haloalkane dehalogenase
MHYVDEGEGPVILFCHGNPTWSFLYRGIITRLRDRFRCVAADLHGFGLSERPAGYRYTAAEQARTLGELVDHLQLEQFVVMGQDWGGPTGLGVAVERADRVRGLVLGNTWFWPSDGVLFKVFSRTAGTPPAQWLIVHHNAFVHLMPSLSARRLTREERNHYLGVQPNAPARVGTAAFPREILAARTFLAELERLVPERLGEKPTLITWGMKDWGFREAERERMRSAFRNHTFIALANASHFIQEDAPGQIAEAITQHFSS